MPWYSLRDVLTTIKDLLSIVDRNSKHADKTVDALVAIQTAIVETRKFITEVGYETNTDLTKLWLNAFDKVKKAKIYHDGDFPEFLYNKARFWGEPRHWLKEDGSMELIPTLMKLERECDSILVKIK